MRVRWQSQQIKRYTGWFAQIWQVANIRELQADLEKLDAVLADTQTALKHDRTTTVSIMQLPSYSLVLKRYNPRTHGHVFSRALRQTRARRCWKMSYAFAQAGLNVARPVLMYEQRFGLIRRNAYFANTMLNGEELLSALPNMATPKQQEVVQAIKSAFSKMQAAKLTHGDMKASNLIWVNGALYFIDLDAAIRHRSWLTWRVSHNKDRKRFLRNWHDQPHLLALFSDC